MQVVCVLSRDDDPRLSSFPPAGLRQLLGQVQPAGAAMPQQNCLAAVTLGNLAPWLLWVHICCLFRTMLADSFLSAMSSSGLLLSLGSTWASPDSP